MDRNFSGITFALILVAITPCFGQSTSPTPAATPQSSEANIEAPTPANPANIEEARRKLQQLPPEERLKLRDNLQKWKAMSKEERESLRLQAQKRRERLEQGVDEFVKKSGLVLDPERRKQLSERFFEERTKIEAALRKEMEEKRRPMLKQMREKLKAEFSVAAAVPASTPASTAVITPAPSATPVP